MYEYRVKLIPASAFAEGESGFVVEFPDWSWGVAQGETMPDALANAADALDKMIAATLRDGGELPPLGELREGERLLAPSAQMVLKAAVATGLQDAKISFTELGRRLNIDEKEARRIADPRHPTKLARLEKALAALGRRISLRVEAA